MGVSSKQCFLLGGLALIFGCCCGVAVLVWEHQRREILSHGQDATAVVWGHHRTGKGEGDYIVDVRYRLNQQTQRASAFVTEELYDSVHVDQKVSIKYLDDAPDEVVVVGDGFPYCRSAFVSCLSLFGALLLGVIGWMVGRSE